MGTVGDDIDLGATGVLDLCDPGSDKEKAAEILWMISICCTLGLAIGRMVCSKKRRRKLKKKLKMTQSQLKLSDAQLGDGDPEITPVLKNKRTHESFCEANNAFVRRNMRDSQATYRSLKKDVTLRKSIMNSVLGNKRVYLRALVWACISTLASGFAQYSILEYGDASTTQALDCTYTIATDIVFLTMLLVADYVSAETSRWHSIQHAAWNVQGGIVDVARMIGSHITNDPERKLAYRSHRYLTLAHVLLHKDANKEYKFELEDLVRSGLVDHTEHSEGRALTLLSENPEEGVLGWIEQLLDYCLEKKHLPLSSVFVVEILSTLRDQMQFFRNAQSDQPPASWTILMGLLIQVQSFLFCFGFAGSTTTGHFTGTDMCAALITTWRPFLATFIVTSVFNFLYVLCDVLQDPYDGEVGVDNLDIDTLVIRTERLTYHHLRAAHMDVRAHITKDLSRKGFFVQELDDVGGAWDRTSNLTGTSNLSGTARSDRGESFGSNPMKACQSEPGKARAWSRANQFKPPGNDGEMSLDAREKSIDAEKAGIELTSASTQETTQQSASL